MLKKIQLTQLRKGMFIDEFCGSWIDHPFWKKSFLVTTQEEFSNILASKIEELIIDTSRGLDVLVEVEASEPEPEVAPPATVEPTPVVVALTMDQELNNATKIVEQSKKAVFNMFQEARMGNAVNVDSMQPLVEEISASVNRNSGALIGLARLKTKDDYTYMHSVAVCARGSPPVSRPMSCGR